MDKLTKQAEALGIKVDGRWSEDRLREEIAEAQAAKDAADEKARLEAEALAKSEAEAQAKAEEEARLAAEKLAEEEAQAKADQERKDAELKAAQEQAEIDAKAEAEREAQAAALEEETQQASMVLVNLQANPMRHLGLEGYGKAVIRPDQLDQITLKRIRRGVELGLLKVEE